MLLNLINSDPVQSFCSYIRKHRFNQGAKLCGVDLKQNYLNFKLYIELLNVPSEEITQEFLGSVVSKQFYEWVLSWDKTRKSGLAFGIKVDSNNVSKKYFHIKFHQEFKQALFAKQFLFLRLLRIDVNSLYKGISYEIQSDDNFYQKFYVYVKDPIEIGKVLAYKNMAHNLDISEIDELELYATKDSFKINIINQLDNFKVKQDVWKIIPDKLKSSLRQCVQILDAAPIYTGITSSQTISAYFSFTKKDSNILNL